MSRFRYVPDSEEAPGPRSPTGRYSSDVIRALQERLQARGFYSGAIDGEPGPGTRNGLKALARSVGLTEREVRGLSYSGNNFEANTSAIEQWLGHGDRATRMGLGNLGASWPGGPISPVGVAHDSRIAAFQNLLRSTTSPTTGRPYMGANDSLRTALSRFSQDFNYRLPLNQLTGNTQRDAGLVDQWLNNTGFQSRVRSLAEYAAREGATRITDANALAGPAEIRAFQHAQRWLDGGRTQVTGVLDSATQQAAARHLRGTRDHGPGWGVTGPDSPEADFRFGAREVERGPDPWLGGDRPTHTRRFAYDPTAEVN